MLNNKQQILLNVEYDFYSAFKIKIQHLFKQSGEHVTRVKWLRMKLRMNEIRV